MAEGAQLILYPHATTMLSDQCKYGIVYSQCHRYYMRCTLLKDFQEACKILIETLALYHCRYCRGLCCEEGDSTAGTGLLPPSLSPPGVAHRGVVGVVWGRGAPPSGEVVRSAGGCRGLVVGTVTRVGEGQRERGTGPRGRSPLWAWRLARFRSTLWLDSRIEPGRRVTPCA
jgi:hypothetical protein